jgi:MFS family permease
LPSHRLRSRWTILAIASGAEASFAAVSWGLPVLAPALRAHFDLTLSQVGIALGCINFGLLATLFAWGVVADKIGERPVIVLGLAGVAAAMGAAALAGSFGPFAGALIVAGMAGGSVTAAGGRAVLFAFPLRRGLVLGIRQTAAPLGAILGAVTLPVLDAAFGLRTTLLALALFCLPAAAAALMLPVSSRTQVALRASCHPVRNRRLWQLSAGSSLLVVSQLAVLSFVVIFLRDARGFSTGQAAAVLAGIQGAGAAARLASGYLSDRLGGPMLPLRWLSLAIAAALGLVASATHAPAGLLVPVLVLAGALALGWNGLSFTAVGELAALGDSGAALGLQQTALNASGAIAPVLFAIVVGQASWAVGFLVIGAFPLIGYFVFTSLPTRLAARAEPLPRA